MKKKRKNEKNKNKNKNDASGKAEQKIISGSPHTETGASGFPVQARRELRVKAFPPSRVLTLGREKSRVLGGCFLSSHGSCFEKIDQ
jgi:hypothetical protein